MTFGLLTPHLKASCAGALLLFSFAQAQAAEPSRKNPEEVKVTSQQMHQIEVTPAQPRSFHPQKAAIGQIALEVTP